MEIRNNIHLYEDKKVRSVWNAEKECWWFSVVDVIAALTDSVNPTDYLKKMRKRDELLAEYLGTNCPRVEMVGSCWSRTHRGNNRSGAGDRPSVRDIPA